MNPRLVLWKDKWDWQTFNQTHQDTKERTQINKIRNKRKITTDTKEIQTIVRKYHEQLDANKLDKLDEMDKFLETYDLPKLNQKE